MGARRAPGGGRKRLPSAIHVLRGTAQPSRMNPNEPQPERGIPPPPRGLDKMQQTHWRAVAAELDSMGVLTKVDRVQLMNLVIAEVRVKRANAKVSKHGAVTADGKRSAWVLELNQAQLVVARLAAAFGLDPSSRPRVSADPAAAAARSQQAQQPAPTRDLGDRLFG